MTATLRQRLFFALWPDDETRRALAGLSRVRLPSGSGRPVAAENLHLTLVFLGSVDSGVRACAEQAAERLSGRAFALEFRHIGYWRRSQVLCAVPDCIPDALSGLVSSLSSALVQCGHEPESRPFRAHLTLARKLRGFVGETTHAPICWRVGDFHLLASETLPQGARYRRLRSWRLE